MQDEEWDERELCPLEAQLLGTMVEWLPVADAVAVARLYCVPRSTGLVALLHLAQQRLVSEWTVTDTHGIEPTGVFAITTRGRLVAELLGLTVDTSPWTDDPLPKPS